MARTENLTVMFTDIVDFTERTMRQSRAESEAMLAHHDRMLLPLIARFGGRRVACLSWASELAVPLIRRYPGPEVIAALSARSGELGTRGAERAVALLEELGYADRIDPLYLATSDLGTSTTCEGKRDAIRRLRALGDPRGLPALRASVGSGMRDWFRNRCFRSEALAAIEEIEQAQASDPG